MLCLLISVIHISQEAIVSEMNISASHFSTGKGTRFQTFTEHKGDQNAARAGILAFANQPTNERT